MKTELATPMNVPNQPGSPWEMPQAAAFLKVSEDNLRKKAKAGLLRTIRIGYRILIPDDEMKRIAENGL